MAQETAEEHRAEIGDVFFSPVVEDSGEGRFTLTVDADTLAGILVACNRGQEWMADCCGIHETRWDDLVGEIESNPSFCTIRALAECAAVKRQRAK